MADLIRSVWLSWEVACVILKVMDLQLREMAENQDIAWPPEE